MNRSQKNYYEWLLGRREDPGHIEYHENGTPDFTTDGERHEVKKRYGEQLLVHSDAQASFIENGGSDDYLVIMPEAPSEDDTPLAVIPCTALGGVGDPIPHGTLEAHSPRETIPFFTDGFTFTLAHKQGRRKDIRFPEGLAESIDGIVKRNASYDGFPQVVRAACRKLVEEREEYSEAT